MPENITVHLDAGYDSTKTRGLLDELDCRSVISKKGFPLQAGNDASSSEPTPGTTTVQEARHLQ